MMHVMVVGMDADQIAALVLGIDSSDAIAGIATVTSILPLDVDVIATVTGIASVIGDDDSISKISDTELDGLRKTKRRVC
jgi:L-fucose mutarotase/ribose pyranase (RbsD/FucU family)